MRIQEGLVSESFQKARNLRTARFYVFLLLREFFTCYAEKNFSYLHAAAEVVQSQLAIEGHESLTDLVEFER